MQVLYIYEKLLRIIRERKESVNDTICHGAVTDFVSFKELRAKLVELDYIEQELKDLLERETEQDD
jgi:hypothetical protein|tara:strand:+ start:708 stop:905 length:198 start_codon:yes stop_codon:yes gene_type:complete